MTDPTPETRSVVVERELPHPPEKLWRALTQPHLIADWLMQNDFLPRVGHRFELRGEWGSVSCEVLEIEPHRILIYSWCAMGLESIVTFTLAPAGAGTHLRVEQRGFRPDQEQAYRGAAFGWQRFLGNLEQVLQRPD